MTVGGELLENGLRGIVSRFGVSPTMLGNTAISALTEAEEIGPVIPRRTTESRRGVRFDRAAYRERNRVERLINRLTQHRAIATRYEKLAVSYHALLTIACILLWL